MRCVHTGRDLNPKQGSTATREARNPPTRSAICGASQRRGNPLIRPRRLFRNPQAGFPPRGFPIFTVTAPSAPASHRSMHPGRVRSPKIPSRSHHSAPAKPSIASRRTKKGSLSPINGKPIPPTRAKLPAQTAHASHGVRKAYQHEKSHLSLGHQAIWLR
jgi:hypothetical protein